MHTASASTRLAKAGVLALKVYTCHILVFTAGCIAGATEAFLVLAVMWGP
jgi:hypothetical protein